MQEQKTELIEKLTYPLQTSEQKLNAILDCISNITYLNEDTVCISFNKNLVIYNDGDTVSITKGTQVNIANKIHLNPTIELKEFYNNPKSLNTLLELEE